MTNERRITTHSPATALMQTVNTLLQPHFSFSSSSFDSTWNASGFPKRNVIKNDENSVTFEFALAGFKKEDISVSIREGILHISATCKEDTDREYIVKGISEKSVSEKYQVLPGTKVTKASFTDGILSVHLSRDVPPEEKIEIE